MPVTAPTQLRFVHDATELSEFLRNLRLLVCKYPVEGICPFAEAGGNSRG